MVVIYVDVSVDITSNISITITTIIMKDCLTK